MRPNALKARFHGVRPKSTGGWPGRALPRHETAHAALLADILDLVHGASLVAKDQSAPPLTDELRVLRYLPTNLPRSEIAGELSVSPNTVSTHIRSIYAKLGAADRSAAVRRVREPRLLASRPQLASS